MSLKLNYNINAEVRGGPKLAIVADLPIAGYSYFQFDVEALSTRQVDLHLEPPESIQLLAIACDQQDRQVSFSVPGGTVPEISLATPQLLMGDGAKLLGPPPPYLQLKNDLDGPATVRILVGRTVEAGPTPATPATTGAPATPGTELEAGASPRTSSRAATPTSRSAAPRNAAPARTEPPPPGDVVPSDTDAQQGGDEAS